MRSIIVIALALLFAAPAPAQTVNYRGQTYSGRVCDNTNCTMCNRIEAGLMSARAGAPVCTGPNCQLGVTYLPLQSPRLFTPVQKPVAAATGVGGLADTTLEPSPQWAVEAMLELVAPQPGMTVMDLGCGDGRILIEAAKRYRAHGVGIELNRESAALARSNAKAAGVSDLVTVCVADLRDQDAYGADIITLYLFPELIAAVWPKIEPGSVVVSLNHPLPAAYSRRVERKHDGDTAVFYVGVKRR